MKAPIKFTIIIPCYNTENTVLETLESVSNLEYKLWEAIIVNDGSPDNLELLVLDFIKNDKRFRYYKKENGGLASARNYAIQKATGDYILPLDSDNMLRPQFLNWAVDIIEDETETIHVIYGDAMRFGDVNKRWNVGAFDKFKMLNWNYIDACSIIHKDVFNRVGLYDAKMPYQGLEDWDLWLGCINEGLKFHYLHKITFDYRVTNNSMIKGFDDRMNKVSKKYIINKHSDLYHSAINELRIRNHKSEAQWNRLSNNLSFKIFRKLKIF